MALASQRPTVPKPTIVNRSGRIRFGSTTPIYSATRGERILQEQGRCVGQADARQIWRQHVFADRPHAALDPCDEVVEGLNARLAVEAATTGRAHDPLHRQVV